MQRLVSLDVLRGITVASMVMMNNPGPGDAVFPALRHSVWHGWTFTDMVFPFFLWMVGVSMTFSFARRREAGDGVKGLASHALRRGVAICGLGLLFNFLLVLDVAQLRIPGVLQRIGICYTVTAAIYLFTSPAGVGMAAAGLLALYGVLMMGHGYADPWAFTNNYARSIDTTWLAGHLWSETRVWDPEGLVSTVPAIVTCLLGTLAGDWIRSSRGPSAKVRGLLLSGAALTLAGWAAGHWMPINKNLWTDSFTLLMSGLASIALAGLYALCDVHRVRVEIFRVYGTNSLVLFVLSGMLATALSATGAGNWLWQHLYSGLFADLRMGSLAFALTEVGLIFGAAWLLDRQRVMIRL